VGAHRRPFLPALALLLVACGGGGGGGAPSTRVQDVVLSVDPTFGAKNVSVDAVVTVQFATSMDDATLTSGALIVSPLGLNAPVDADVTLTGGGMKATLRPRKPLQGDRDYQVRLSTLARLSGGRAVRRPWYSNFRTGGDAAPPPPPVPPSQGGTVLATGALNRGRSGHAAVALQDGRVAVFGGYDTSASVTDTIEVYDPVQGMWGVAHGRLRTARARIAAAVLSDGRVFLAGGETASTTDVGVDQWEIWDPVTSDLSSWGALRERRTRARAVALGNGLVLVVGGSRTDSSGGPNFSRSSTEHFDPVTGASTTGPSMSVTRAGHEATLLADGRVLVTGGHGSITLCETYDPSTATFQSAGSMSNPRRDHSATLLSDGSVLVAGGGNYTADLWVADRLTFFQMQNLGDLRSLHTATLIANGRVMVAGGEKPTTGGGTFFHNTMDFFNPPTGSFLFPDIRTRIPRSGHTATLLLDGDVLLVGGKNGVLGSPAIATCDRVHF
jgi:hypothetical protein